MNKIAIAAILLSAPAAVRAEVDFDRGVSIESFMKQAVTAEVVPARNAAEDIGIQMHVAKIEIANITKDTALLASGMNLLEVEAQAIAQGAPAKLFQAKMETARKPLAGYYFKLRDVAKLMDKLAKTAEKNTELSGLAGELKEDAFNLYNRIIGTTDVAQKLDSTVDAINSEIIGWETQQIALDIYGRCSELEFQTRDIWLSAKLLETKLAGETEPLPQ